MSHYKWKREILSLNIGKTESENLVYSSLCTLIMAVIIVYGYDTLTKLPLHTGTHNRRDNRPDNVSAILLGSFYSATSNWWEHFAFCLTWSRLGQQAPLLQSGPIVRRTAQWRDKGGKSLSIDTRYRQILPEMFRCLYIEPTMAIFGHGPVTVGDSSHGSDLGWFTVTKPMIHHKTSPRCVSALCLLGVSPQ